MFSLIVTIIAIVLVAALVLATIYYAGEAYRSSQTRATAVSVVNQGHQLLGATQLFRVQHGRWPAGEQELVSFAFLNSIPIAPPGTASTHTTSTSWNQVQDGSPAFWVLRNVSEDVCRAINQQVRGDNGIYKAAKPQLAVQCFGQDEEFTALVHMISPVPEENIEVVVPLNGGTPVLEVDPSGNGWVRPPTNITEPGSSTPPPTPPVASVDVRYYDTAANTPVASWAFGNVAVGATSGQKNLEVKNEGTSDFVIGTPAFQVAAPFAIATSNCPAVLSVGQSCSLGLTFKPTARGLASRTVSMPTATGATPSLALSGTGIAQSTITSFTPTSVKAAAGQTITVTGTNFVEGATASIGGKTATVVVNSPTSMTLTTPTLVPGSYPLQVTIPNTNVTQSGGSVQVLPSEPVVEVQDNTNTKVDQITFASTKAGTTSPSLTYNVVNKGPVDLVFGSTPFTVAAPFSLVSTTCAGTVAAGGKCAVTMAFSPSDATTYSGKYLSMSSNIASPTLPTLTGPGAPAGLNGTVTFLEGGAKRFTVGPDSETVYYINKTTAPTWLYKQVQGSAAQGIPVSFTDTCRSQPNADADELFYPIDVAYDHTTSSLFVSGTCQGARYTYHPLQLLKVSLADFSGSIVYTLAKPTTQISNQMYGYLSANKTGQLALSHYNGALGFRTSDNKQGGSVGWSGGDYALPLKDLRPSYSYPNVMIWAYAYISLSRACVDSTCGLSARGPVIGRDVAANGDLITVDQYGVTKNVMTYNADGSFKSQGSQEFVATLSGYALGSNGKVVIAQDGSIYGYTDTKKLFRIQ